MPNHDDADVLHRLQLLFREQAARAADARDVAAAAASTALLQTIRGEITRRLDERLGRILALAARAEHMSHAEFMGAYAELFGASGTSREEIAKGICDWVSRALPDRDMQQRVVQQVLGRLKPESDAGC